MRELWGPVWLVTTLCILGVVGLAIGRVESVLPAFFCFLPVVFCLQVRVIQTLIRRIEALEG